MRWGINVLLESQAAPLPCSSPVARPSHSLLRWRTPPILFSGSNGQIRSARADLATRVRRGSLDPGHRSGTAREAGKRRAASGADARHKSMGLPSSRHRGQLLRPRLTRLGTLAAQPAAKGLRAALGWRLASNPA
ncbi:hypothetical protein GUJ93_ZPchr0010g10714 [Zizania palustris]|uniref:Uncharacterized protein n=1 Tax=Zizania palustris TaxID=103762 RepID=A0A8J5WH94_ZIZPA|nr:hypothetical protein GUJ93_ZPchr0010g10714 [Zizania palustris]